MLFVRWTRLALLHAWNQVSKRMVSAIVCAAGESKRMGSQNKLLLEIESRPMIRHVVSRIICSDIGEVIVVCGHQAVEIQTALKGLNVYFAHNPDYVRGLSTSIQAGVRAASKQAVGYMICLGDLPGLTERDYNRILAEFETAVSHDDRAIVRPTYADTPGHPVVMSSAFLSEILITDDQPGCRNVVRRHRNHVSEITWAHDAVIRDVDTPQAYQSQVL